MSTMVLDKKAEPALQTGSDRPWKVIVKNDSHNSFQGVAVALSEVLPGVDFDEGMQMAEKIDREGSAIVWMGLREPAELYWSELKARGLTMAPLKQ